MNKVTFNTKGHDSFIDFIKGFSIICVVVTHIAPEFFKDYTLFALWGDMAVPLFLIVQVFHVYKKGKIDVQKYFNFSKLCRRIILPFVITMCITIGWTIWRSGDMMSTLKSAIYSGGLGPGSYYVWIYLQFFLLLPFLYKIVNSKIGGGILLIISVLLEMICSWTDCPDVIYRLLCFRYIFLIWFGYQWAKGYIELTNKRIIISLISALCILIYWFSDINLEPFVFQTGWRIFHWFSYFWVGWLLVFILKTIYHYIPARLNNLIEYFGQQSYDIFLWQMIVFTIAPWNIITRDVNQISAVILNVLFAIGICLLPFCVLMRVKKLK